MLGAFTWPHPTALSPSPSHRHQRRSNACEATFVCQWTAAGVRCFSVVSSQLQCGAPWSQLRRGSSSNNSSGQRHRLRRHQPSEPRCTSGQAHYGVRRSTDLPAPGDNPRHCLQLTPLASFPFTLHQLVFLKALSVTDSLDEAADLLMKSKTNVRMVVSKLEVDLGRHLDLPTVPGPTAADEGKLLLVRLPKRSRSQLTGVGKLLSKYSDRLMYLVADTLSAMKDLQDVKTGQMFIGASQTTGVYILPRLIERFKRKHPEVTVQLQVENTRRCCQAVTRGHVDIAVVGGEIPHDLAHLLQITPYQEDEVVLVVSPEHPWAGAGQVEVADLRQLRFVSLQKSSTVQGIRNILQGHGVVWSSLQVVMEVNSVEAIKNAVEVGLGAAFVSRSAVDKEVALGRLAVLTVRGVPLRRTLLCVTDPVRYCSQAVRAFIEEMFGLTIETSASGCFLPGQGACCDIWASRSGSGERYPSLQGRGPQISDMSALRWEDSQSAAASVDGEEPASEHAEVSVSALPQLEKLSFTLQHMVIFRMVARTGSIKDAAMALSLSAGAVSKSIAALEQTFGGEGKLVQRGHGRIYRTEAGDLFLRYCESMLSVATEACKALQDYSCANTGVVTLGASPTTGTYLLPRLIAVFRQRNPQVVVQLRVDHCHRVCEAVAGGELDVAIVIGDIPDELSDTLEAVPYAEDELVLIVPRDHPLADVGQVTRDGLYSLTFVSVNAGSPVQSAQETTLHKHGILWRRLKVDMEFNNVEAIKGAVQAGLGVAFVSVLAIEKELSLGLVARVRIDGVTLPRTLWLINDPLRSLSQAGRKFMSEVFALDPGTSSDSETNGSNGSNGTGNGANGRAPARVPRRIPLRSDQRMPWEISVSASGSVSE